MPFIIWVENNFINKLAKKVKAEFIFSDGRYGSYGKNIASFLLTHQIQFSLPYGFGIFQGFVDWFNYHSFKKFDAIIIPDYEDKKNNLAGNLARHKMLERLRHHYVGVLTLSSLKSVAVKDINALFTISGYLDEHRPTFIAELVEQAKKISGKKVFVLGNPHDTEKVFIKEHDIEIYPSASGNFREDLFSRAKWIISRSGYTTIMDLAELETPGFLIPTPGQTEQEYLAKYLGDKGHFLTANKCKIDLSVIGSTDNNSLVHFKAPWKTEESVRRVRELVSKYILWYK